MSRKAILSVPNLNSKLVLNSEARRLGVNTPARRRLRDEANAKLKARADAEASLPLQLEEKIEQASSLVQGLLDAAKELAVHREELVKHAKPQTVRLALAIAAKLLVRELESNEQFALAAVHDALENTTLADLVRIRLNPQDRAIIEETLQYELGAGTVELTADNTISRGGCMVDTRFGTIDATIDTRWANMVKALQHEMDPGGPEQSESVAQIQTTLASEATTETSSMEKANA